MTDHCDVEALSPHEGQSGDAAAAKATAAVTEHVDVEGEDIAPFPDALFSEHGQEIRSMWAEPDASAIQVRGPTYMEDNIKVSSGPALGKLLHVDAWNVASYEQRHHIARTEELRPNSVLKHCQREHPHSLVFILNIELPNAENTCIVSYWLLPKLRDAQSDAAHDKTRNFHRLLWAFCNTEDDEFRTQRFKLIPDFANAPWVFQQLVPSHPALTGNKLTQHYFRRANYFELDLDIASSTVASSIGSLCCSWATYLDVHVFMTIQGEEEDELPERVIGGVSFKYLDLAKATPLES
ncbi:hypothetical protein Gpo141_00003408 [Globisporangium polare]